MEVALVDEAAGFVDDEEGVDDPVWASGTVAKGCAVRDYEAGGERGGGRWHFLHDGSRMADGMDNVAVGVELMLGCPFPAGARSVGGEEKSSGKLLQGTKANEVP